MDSRGLLLLVGGIPIWGNWQVVVNRGGSFIPLFGGVMASIGGAVLPIANAWKVSWIALLLDPGCVYAMGMLLVQRKRETSRTGKRKE